MTHGQMAEELAAMASEMKTAVGLLGDMLDHIERALEWAEKQEKAGKELARMYREKAEGEQ